MSSTQKKDNDNDLLFYSLANVKYVELEASPAQDLDEKSSK